MLMFKKTHLAFVAATNDHIAQREKLALRDAETIGRLQRENARLLAELADMKAKRARSNGNLIPGGAKKKAAVLAERAGTNV